MNRCYPRYNREFHCDILLRLMDDPDVIENTVNCALEINRNPMDEEYETFILSSRWREHDEGSVVYFFKDKLERLGHPFWVFKASKKKGN